MKAKSTFTKRIYKRLPKAVKRYWRRKQIASSFYRNRRRLLSVLKEIERLWDRI